MDQVAIAVHVTQNSAHLAETLACVTSTTPASTPCRVYHLPSGSHSSPLAASLSRISRECPAEIYVLLEHGALPVSCWLDEILSVFGRVPSCGLVGPSTNRSSSPQGVFRCKDTGAVENAVAARLRYGHSYRSLGRNVYLDGFCLGIRSGILNLNVPSWGSDSWLRELSICAARSSFSALWACSAYVHRLPSLPLPAAPASSYSVPNSRLLCDLNLPAIPASDPYMPSAAGYVEERPPVLPREAETGAPVPQAVPLASCIMPTFNRRLFVPRAIRSFLSQDYPNTELIIVDDGTDPIANLLPDDPRVRYFRLPSRQNVGAKRNFACEQARGTFILHWDDDEWYSPSRITRQVNSLRDSTARISGTSVALFYNESSDRTFRYCYGGQGAGWMGALAYPISVWKERAFDAVPIAEDVRFISRVPLNLRMDLKDPFLYVASIHTANTSPKITTGSYWKPESRESLRAFAGFAPIAEFSVSSGRSR